MDMKKVIDKADWPMAAGVFQAVALACLTWVWYGHFRDPGASGGRLIYLLTSAGCFLVPALLSIILARGNPVRYALCLTGCRAYIWLIPLTALSCGLPVHIALTGTLLFTAACICLAPADGAVALVISSALMAFFLPSIVGDEELKSHALLLGQAFAAALALLWRLLLVRIISAYLFAQSRDPAVEEALREKVAGLSAERKLLREEMATHIVEINQVLAEAKGQASPAPAKIAKESRS
jgi:hypothetical protein